MAQDVIIDPITGQLTIRKRPKSLRGRGGGGGYPQQSTVIGVGTSLVSGSAGSILFINGSQQLGEDNANFFYNDTSNNVSLGTTTDFGGKLNIKIGTATERGIHVQAFNAASTGNFLTFERSDGTDIFTVEKPTQTEIILISGVPSTPLRNVANAVGPAGYSALGNSGSTYGAFFAESKTSNNPGLFFGVQTLGALPTAGANQVSLQFGYADANTMAGLPLIDGYAFSNFSSSADVSVQFKSYFNSGVRAWTLLPQGQLITGGVTAVPSVEAYLTIDNDNPVTVADGRRGLIINIDSGAVGDPISIYDASDNLAHQFAASGAMVFNEQGAAVDYRIESDTDANMFFLSGANNSITFGATTNLAKVGIDGNTDVVQFLVQGHSTQTNVIALVEASNGQDYFQVIDSGSSVGGIKAGSIGLADEFQAIHGSAMTWNRGGLMGHYWSSPTNAPLDYTLKTNTYASITVNPGNNVSAPQDLILDINGTGGNVGRFIVDANSNESYFGPGVTNATPVAHIINGTGGSGTNVAAAKFTVAGGKGTGNAVPSHLALAATALGGASGTTLQTLVDRYILGASKVLTNNTVTALVNHTIANNTVVAGILSYAVEVTDGTDVQIEEGKVAFHATNKAGTIANNTTVKYGNQQAATAGTLTVTFTITAANPAVVSVNANSSLTVSSGFPRVTYSIQNLTQQATAIQ